MKKTIKSVAEKNKTSTNEVRAQIQSAIHQAMKNRNANEFSKTFWNEISPDGSEPSVEKFCLHIKKYLQNTNY